MELDSFEWIVSFMRPLDINTRKKIGGVPDGTHGTHIDAPLQLREFLTAPGVPRIMAYRRRMTVYWIDLSGPREQGRGHAFALASRGEKKTGYRLHSLGSI